MVLDAPPIKAVIQDFADFVGDLPVVGHNVNFDLDFLKVHHSFDKNIVNDTFEIAAVLLPSAPRYSLSALVDTLQASNKQPHRAQEDAEATMMVFIKLYEMALELPTHLLAEIVQAAQNIKWDAAYFFTQVFKNKTRELPKARQAKQKDYGVLFSEPG